MKRSDRGEGKKKERFEKNLIRRKSDNSQNKQTNVCRAQPRVKKLINKQKYKRDY